MAERQFALSRIASILKFEWASSDPTADLMLPGAAVIPAELKAVETHFAMVALEAGFTLPREEMNR